MNGPDHYQEAERLLAEAVAQVPIHQAGGDPWQAVPQDDDPEMVPKYGPDEAAAIAALAQAHATLAAAAATIDAAAHPNQSQVDYLSAWWRAM